MVFASWPTTFQYHVVEWVNVIPVTNLARLQIAVSTNAGSSYTNVTWDNGGFDAPSNGGGTFVSNAAASATPDILLGNTQSNTTDEGYNGWLYLWGLDSSVFRKTMQQYASHPLTTTASTFRNLEYHIRLTTQVTAIRFIYNSGNISSGTFNFYGIN